jgi:nicotinamidase-related amidase
VREALLVIDMVNDFIDGSLANEAAPRTFDPINAAIHAFRAVGNPVIFCNDAHQLNDVEFAVFPPHALRGSQGAQVTGFLDAGIYREEVPKRFYSAFTATDLDVTLRSLGVQKLVLAGQHTDCCVRHTAYDAFLRGYALEVLRDGTCVYVPAGSDEPRPAQDARHEAALQYLQTFYGARAIGARDLAGA